MTENPVPYIRFCRDDDKDKLLAFVREGHDESAMFTLSDRKVRTNIAHALEPPRDANGQINHLVIIGIIDAPDRDAIAASIAFEYTQPWYSDDWVLWELWNNVRPDYRKSSYARDLIKFGKWISDSTSRPLAMSIYTTERLEAKVNMYRRKMPQIGAVFAHNMNLCRGPAIARMV